MEVMNREAAKLGLQVLFHENLGRSQPVFLEAGKANPTPGKRHQILP